MFPKISGNSLDIKLEIPVLSLQEVADSNGSLDSLIEDMRKKVSYAYPHLKIYSIQFSQELNEFAKIIVHLGNLVNSEMLVEVVSQNLIEIE